MRFFKLWELPSLKNGFSSSKIDFLIIFLKSVWGVWGLPKHVWGFGGCLRTHLEPLEAIWEHFLKNENFEFFRFFSTKNEGFSLLLVGILSMEMQKMLFFKKYLFNQKSARQIFALGHILSPLNVVGHETKYLRKFCFVNIAQKCVFSSSESSQAWKMDFQARKSIFSKNFWSVSGVLGGFQKMFWSPGGA